jgi:hypothetical protein
VCAGDASTLFAREAFAVTFEMFTDVHRDAAGTRRGDATGARCVLCANVRVAIYANTRVGASVKAVSIDVTKSRVISSAMYRARSRRLSRAGNATQVGFPAD